ncbi:hypothetical protein, partial [Thermococcus sp.]|uniref:hypothetical protein n=1 Tax=Thermococcus sp. TaxID=35749 RepID=UPI0026033E41
PVYVVAYVVSQPSAFHTTLFYGNSLYLNQEFSTKRSSHTTLFYGNWKVYRLLQYPQEIREKASHTTLFYGNPLEISIFSQNKRSYNSYLSLTVKTRVTARHL